MNTKMTGGRKEFAIVHSRDVVENPVRKIVFSKSGSILQKSPESADRKDGEQERLRLRVSKIPDIPQAT